MGNALRLIVFCLALAAVGSTAALTQLWVRERARARPPSSADLPANVVSRAEHQAHRSDQQKALVVVVAVSFAALLVVALAAGLRAHAAPSPESVAHNRGEMKQVEHFARAAADREAALHREKEERRRADENLHIQQLLLNQALGEKLRLGRDLHDGVIQSLYAVGLTLESSRQKRPHDPAAADALLDRGVQMLNASIREIRAYIDSLSQPQPVMKHGFSTALGSLLESVRGDQSAEFVVRIDEAAENRLDPSRMPDILQIVREAVSNALRHGGAACVTIRLHEDGDRVALLVQDDGRGFDPSALEHEGHGLANFRARAASLGADLRLDSQPGAGARVVLTIPAPASPA